jgi:hypothetical protein
MQLFFFRKTSSSARKSSEPARLCLIDTAHNRFVMQTLDSSDKAMDGVSQLGLGKSWHPEAGQ